MFNSIYKFSMEENIHFLLNLDNIHFFILNNLTLLNINKLLINNFGLNQKLLLLHEFKVQIER